VPADEIQISNSDKDRDQVDIKRKQQFLDLWNTYFPGADLPIVLSYAEEKMEPDPNAAAPDERPYCLICSLTAMGNGASQRFDVSTLQCGGARRYLGFEPEVRPNFPYFLSCGIPGEIEGERYKQSPELVRRYLESQPTFHAPGPTIVFSRWDALEEDDSPEIVIFFATADVLSGLFTLANYDEADPQAVVAPFGSGCASIVYQPYQELQSQHPRAVLGMFDVSARPCVPPDVLSFAVPWPKFIDMLGQMDESFLITGSWEKVRARI
jgi:hypothetical protein